MMKKKSPSQNGVGELPLTAFYTQIAECAWDAGVHAQLVQDYAGIHDIAGLRYSIKCLIATTKATAGTMCDLLAELEGVA
jgi:hypothetical protein